MKQINNINGQKTKKLNANLKAISKLKKTRLYKVAILSIAAVSIAAVILYTQGCVAIEKAPDIEYITEYYGENTKENEVIDYINISKTLNSLKLNEYIADVSLYEKFNISNELKSVDEILEMINNFNKNYTGSNKNLTEQNKYIEDILNLKVQEKLVYRYIYNTGYDVANKAISTATKKYVAETFGIDDYTKIECRYYADNEECVVIEYKDGKIRKNCVINRNAFDKNREQIFDGVISMTKTNKEYDKNKKDNDCYNEERNKYILEALETSVEINNENNNKNLYDSSLADNMKIR